MTQYCFQIIMRSNSYKNHPTVILSIQNDHSSLVMHQWSFRLFFRIINDQQQMATVMNLRALMHNSRYIQESSGSTFVAFYGDNNGRLGVFIGGATHITVHAWRMVCDAFKYAVDREPLKNGILCISLYYLLMYIL